MRLARQGQDARLQAFVLAGDTRSQAWIRALLQDELPAQAYGRLLLAPGSQAPVAVQARGRQVCTCFNVTEDAIEERLATTPGDPDTRLAALQTGLQCGTNCGSCIPELRRLVRAHPAQGVPA
jgi:assimilatory nitrate reductase catalytic subunit